MSDSLPEILTSAAFQLRPRLAACPLTPMDDYVICERLDSEDSVLVPEHLRKKSNKGRVVAVGPGRLLQNGAYAPLPLEIGDIVVFGGYLKEDAGITVNDVKWLICQAGDIVAKVNK
jgi:chaperonin GroES